MNMLKNAGWNNEEDLSRVEKELKAERLRLTKVRIREAEKISFALETMKAVLHELQTCNESEAGCHTVAQMDLHEAIRKLEKN